MAEKIVEVRMFELRYVCEEKVNDVPCDGMLMPTGEVLQVQPPMMKHRCMNCRAVKYLNRQYPQAIGLPVGSPLPEKWLPLLDRDHVNSPPDEKKIVVS